MSGLRPQKARFLVECAICDTEYREDSVPGQSIVNTGCCSFCWAAEPGNLNNHPWSWAVCGYKSSAGVLGSLVRKGYCGQEGSGNDASCWLTDKGKQAYIEHFGQPK